jgi:hypothetical protein
MSWRKSEETESCGLFSLTLTSGLSFHFQIVIIPKSGIYNVTVSQKYPDFGMIAISK